MSILRRFRITHVVITICMISSIVVLLFLFDSGNHIVQGWPPDQSRDIKNYLFDSNGQLEVDIFPKNLCKKKSFLLTMITSSPSNFEHRTAIRETYGSPRQVAGEKLDVYFVLGASAYADVQEKIYEESIKYGDIVQGSFTDSYYNLTLKTVFMMGVLSSYCQNATTFVLKTDDDTYVNMNELVEDLKTEYCGHDEILGYIYYNVNKITSSRNKWYTPDYLYPADSFPNFASGTGYVMSFNTLQKLYQITLITPLMHLEDVFVTGICAAKANVSHISNQKFFYSHRIDMCRIKNVYTVHWENRLPPQQIRKIHELINDKTAANKCDSLWYTLFGWTTSILGI